jgi:diguanylate cyclase (GGDEF)-like protein/PAS domain S-box-containing protein
MSSHTAKPEPEPEAGTNLGPRPTGGDDKEIEPPRRKSARVSRRERESERPPRGAESLPAIADELARSRQLLQVVLDTIPLRVFWKARDGTYLGCNRAFLNESSMTDPSQIIGKTDFELDWRDRAEQFRNEDLVVLDSGKPQLGFEKPEIHKDGRETLVRLNKVPLLDDRGNVVGLLGTIEDLSDHLRAEKALKDSEAFLASILENIPSMVYVKDATTLTFVRVNRATEQTLGRSSKELVSPDSRKLGPADESDYYARMDRQVVDTGQLMEFPLEVLTPPDGRLRYLRTKKVPLFDDQGKPQFVLGISEDITDLKLAEDARRETEERYRRIVDTISDYVVSVKIEDGRVVETAHGAGCFALTGYTAEELTREPGLWISLVVADDNAAAQEQTRRILAGEPPEPLEHRIVRRDGAVRWVRQTPVIHTNADGMPVGYDGVIQDITESRELQEQLLQSANLDSLTAVGSRRLMDFELNQLMASVRRTGHPAAIVMIDIDNFKTYNDAYGHGAGDLVLVDVARGIQQSIRPADRLYRYGGEEFLVSLRVSTMDGAVSAAGRIVNNVAKQAISHLANKPWGVVTISAGAALMTPDQGSLAAVLAEADRSLYESKANGRNRVSPEPGR